MKKNKTKVLVLLAAIIGLTLTVNFIAGNASAKDANAWSMPTQNDSQNALAC